MGNLNMHVSNEGFTELTPMLTSTSVKKLVHPDKYKPIRVVSGQAFINLRILLPKMNAMTSAYNFKQIKVPVTGEIRYHVVRYESTKDVMFKDSILVGNGATWWANRFMEVSGKLTYKDTQIKHIGIHPTPTGGGKTEGHGTYLNAIDGAEICYEDCHIHDIKGNAIQIVNRESETAWPQNWREGLNGRPGKIGVYRTSIISPCQGSERGSFAIAIYNPGQNVEIINSDIVYFEGYPSFRSSGFMYSSRGGILIGDAQDIRQRTNSVHIKGGIIYQNNPLQPALQAQGVDNYKVENLKLYDAGVRKICKIVIDADCKNVDLSITPVDKTEVRVIERSSGKFTEILRSKNRFTFIK